MPSNPSEALLVIQVGGLRFCFTQLCSLGSNELLEVTPANVDKIFKLPLREPKAVILTTILEIRAESIDVDYQPIGRCTQQINGSISCWTQVMQAAFILSEKVSPVVAL